jgi:hypothetical protein
MSKQTTYLSKVEGYAVSYMSIMIIQDLCRSAGRRLIQIPDTRTNTYVEISSLTRVGGKINSHKMRWNFNKLVTN